MNYKNLPISWQEINPTTITGMIYTIRGQKVILDFDLASIYGYTTKALNQQVKRNADKFPTRYMFQITKEESKLLKSHFVTSTASSSEFKSKGGRVKLPFAFTEQGVYMLMTILKGDYATRQSIALIDAFKIMKDMLVGNGELLVNTNPYIESRFSSLHERVRTVETRIDRIMGEFCDPAMQKHFLIFDGCRVEADVAYQTIYSLAKKSIILIDDYIGVKTLELLKTSGVEVSITIISDNVAKNGVTATQLDDFAYDTGKTINLLPTNNRVHDRYVVIDYGYQDETIFHCGASSKDAGGKITTIMRIENPEDYHRIIDALLNQS